MNLEQLKQPIPYKWKVQNFNRDKTKGSCVAYIDARDTMDVLDKVCGPENWQDKYEVVGERFVCSIGIKPENEWVWKSDTGVKAEREAEKSEFSDAFKRAGVKWGIGRFLYDLKIRWVDCKPEGNTAYPIDNNGSRIYDLTEYFGKIDSIRGPSNQQPESRQVNSIPTKTTETQPKTSEGGISEAQTRAIFAISKSKGLSEEEVKKKFNVTSISGLTKQQASDLITNLNAIQ